MGRGNPQTTGSASRRTSSIRHSATSAAHATSSQRALSGLSTRGQTNSFGKSGFDGLCAEHVVSRFVNHLPCAPICEIKLQERHTRTLLVKPVISPARITSKSTAKEQKGTKTKLTSPKATSCPSKTDKNPRASARNRPIEVGPVELLGSRGRFSHSSRFNPSSHSSRLRLNRCG